MFRDIGAAIQTAWTYVLDLLQATFQLVSSLNPTQSAVLWLQIIVGCLTVVWIIFQFAWLRRLNEARLERYLEDRIATERDALAQERAETLAKLDRVTRERGLRYVFLLLWANFRLALSFIVRMLSLGSVHGLADHTALLMQVGMLRRARRVYYDIAQDAMKKIRLYEDALANKRTEAQSALIFAGRVAVLEGLPVAALSSFKKATRLADDPDARLFVGRQLAGSDPDSALKEFRAGLGQTSIEAKPDTKAELHRSIAEIRLKQGRPGLARRELKAAQALDEARGDYLGLGRTEELLGDLYAPRPDNRNAAEQAYRAAIGNFQQANESGRVRVVNAKLRRLMGQSEPSPDNWCTRALDRCAQFLLRTVERRRARANRIGG
jgi:tetratricopeptide (TPR) repeat protein